MDGYVIRTNNTVEKFDWEPPTLDQLQKFVGGRIEAVTVWYAGEEREAYVNEDGKNNELPVNTIGSLVYNYQPGPDGQMEHRFAGDHYDPVMGDLVVIINPSPTT